jgi:hypothetical protein
MGGVVVNDEVKSAVAVIAEFGIYAFEKGQHSCRGGSSFSLLQ